MLIINRKFTNNSQEYLDIVEFCKQSLDYWCEGNAFERALRESECIYRHITGVDIHRYKKNGLFDEGLDADYVKIKTGTKYFYLYNFSKIEKKLAVYDNFCRKYVVDGRVTKRNIIFIKKNWKELWLKHFVKSKTSTKTIKFKDMVLNSLHETN